MRTSVTCRKWWSAGLIALAPSLSAVQAAPIQHGCDVSQGFNPLPTSRAKIGYLTGMTLGDKELATDIQIAPSSGGTTEKVVAVLSDVYWEGDSFAPIEISARVGTRNRLDITRLLHEGLATTEVTFSFTVVGYDPDEDKYYECFYPESNPLHGFIQSSGGDLAISIADEPSMEVLVPHNYEFTIGITPDDSVQDLGISMSVSEKFVKPWGVRVPEPTTLCLLAFGTAALMRPKRAS